MKKPAAKSTRSKAKPKRGGAAKAVPTASATTFPIVGVGASAGELEAFQELLAHLPADTGMGFVLVQHLAPQHESALTQILACATTMPVREVTNNLHVEPNGVYVIPPNTCMAIAGGALKLTPRGKERGATRSIDFFSQALAEDQHERAIGIVLSGTATDGTLGLEATKAEGGVTFAQNESAKYDSMPRSAIAAGCVDFVLSPEAWLRNWRGSRSILASSAAPAGAPAREQGRRRATRGRPPRGQPVCPARCAHRCRAASAAIPRRDRCVSRVARGQGQL